MKDDGGPAFPQTSNEQAHTNPGMTLLDWFAGQVLAGMQANRGATIAPWRAATAYEQAEAMIAEKRRREGA